ncbi:CYCD5-3 [Linum grandiflorum]
MADNLLCNEDIFDIASTPAAHPPSGGHPPDGDADFFRDVCLKYNSSGDQIGGEDEFVRYLAEKETPHGFRVSGGSQSLDLDEWVRGARIKAINWILNTRTALGFRWKTAHLSVSYLDRFLTIFYIEPQWLWAVKLLQVACLSLAAKLDETTAVTLPSFQEMGINFECEAIRRMEIHVMTNLEYRLNTPTPFDYIPCFIVKAAQVCPPREIVSRIVNLVFAFTKDVNLTNHRPSSIAMAAIMAGMDQKLEEAAVVAQVNAFVYAHLLDVGNVVECYSLMRNINVEEDRVESSVIVSPDVSPGRYDGFMGEERSFSVSLGNGKRRRLDFDTLPDRPPGL